MSNEGITFSPPGRNGGTDGSTCPTFPCNMCWTPVQECQQRPNENFFTIIIDAIGVLIFFIFMMLQFWFKVATYILRAAKALYFADRVVQITLSVIAFFVVGSLLFHVLLGSRCYSRDQALLKRQIELELCRSNKLGKAGEAKCAGAAAKKEEPPPIKPLKISLQSPKKYKDVPLNATRVFTVVIFDQKKKRVFESQQEVNIPEKERPPLVMAMQPIVIDNYQ